MKAMLGLLVVLAVVWLWRSARRDAVRPPPDGTLPGAGALQTMVRCAHCGAHLPPADALERDGQPYCSTRHRLAGPRPPHGRR